MRVLCILNCCHIGMLCILLSHGSVVYIVVTRECCAYCCHMGVLYILLSHGSVVYIVNTCE